MSAPLSALPDNRVRPRSNVRVWTIAGVAATSVLLAVVFVIPGLLYPSFGEQQLSGLSQEKRIAVETSRDKLQNDARATLLQALGGSVLLLGAAFTWLQIRLSREQLQRNTEATRQQLALDRQGQITDRFTRAIDQLDTTTHGIDVTLGGIYALERIARDSHVDRATIGEVLTAYIRGHSPWPARLDRQPSAEAAVHELPLLKTRAPDVQAALSVLGRGGFPAVYRSLEGLDLSNTDLRRATLRATNPTDPGLLGAHFEYTHFIGACLDGADLTYGYFEWANFADARLVCANLTSAHFEHAHFVNATFYCPRERVDGPYVELGVDSPDYHTDLAARTQLGGAHLDGADLRAADLREVNLSFAFLVGALLMSADLRGAVLHNAALHGANLAGARLDGIAIRGASCDSETEWPPDFDWQGHGVAVTPRPENPRAHAVRFSGVQDDFAESLLQSARSSTDE